MGTRNGWEAGKATKTTTFVAELQVCIYIYIHLCTVLYVCIYIHIYMS